MVSLSSSSRLSLSLCQTRHTDSLSHVAVPDLTIGVISDIHGVLPAVRTAHALMIRCYSPDVVLCAGDVAAFGPDPAECIDFLISNDISTVRGNTDDLMVDGTDATTPSTDRVNQIMDVMDWSRSQLSSFHRNWLGALPFSMTIAETLVCLHAGPDSNDQIVDADADPPRIPAATAVCAGHLHRPFVTKHAGGIWANAGSVSRPTDADPRGAFIVATRLGGNWRVEIVRFELPLSQILNRVKKTDMPHQERWCETQKSAAWW